MREMFVTGIAIDPRSMQPILVLNDVDNRRALPIWIGQAEATSIGLALDEVKLERPLTHDLMLNVIGVLGFRVDHVDISRNTIGGFSASIALEQEHSEEGEPKRTEIDARPSDAVALALRAGASIHISQELFAEDTIALERSAIEVGPAPDQAEKDQFIEFLKGVKASDFKLPE